MTSSPPSGYIKSDVVLSESQKRAIDKEVDDLVGNNSISYEAEDVDEFRSTPLPTRHFTSESEVVLSESQKKAIEEEVNELAGIPTSSYDAKDAVETAFHDRKSTLDENFKLPKCSKNRGTFTCTKINISNNT